MVAVERPDRDMRKRGAKGGSGDSVSMFHISSHGHDGTRYCTNEQSSKKQFSGARIYSAFNEIPLH